MILELTGGYVADRETEMRSLSTQIRQTPSNQADMILAQDAAFTLREYGFVARREYVDRVAVYVGDAPEFSRLLQLRAKLRDKMIKKGGQA